MKQHLKIKDKQKQPNKQTTTNSHTYLVLCDSPLLHLTQHGLPGRSNSENDREENYSLTILITLFGPVFVISIHCFH